MSIVRGCPTLRGPVLANLAVFLAAIPDDTVQVEGVTGLGDDTLQVPCAGAVQACAEQLSRRASAATRPWMLQEHLPRHLACSCTDHLTLDLYCDT